MRRIIFLAGVGLAIAALTASACGDDEAPEGARVASGKAEALETIELEARDFSFTPDKLEGVVAKPFAVQLINTGDEAHTFTIDEFNIDETLGAGEEKEVVVTPSEPGEFNFYCKFHQGSGMIGAITVSGRPSGDGSPSRPPESSGIDGEGGY